MALTNKLAAIANAIRDKTGKSDSLSLTGMVSEIQNFPITRVFEATQDIEAATTLVAANSLIESHRTDDSLFVAIIPIDTTEPSPWKGTLKCLLASNRQIKEGVYGVLFRMLSNGNTNTGTINKPLTDADNSMVYIGADGSILYTYKGNTPLWTGSYLIVCGWEES